MKNFYLLTWLTLINGACMGFGEDKMNQGGYNYGYQGFGKETVNSIQANGTVSLEGTKVLGLVYVNGSLNAEDADIDSLKVNGQLELKSCLINNNSIVNGSLNAENTEFQKELSVASQKITLRSCSVNSLTVREVSGFNGRQIIDLRSGTKVNGPIIVESENGEIWLSSNSVVSGPISGAQVHRK